LVVRILLTVIQKNEGNDMNTLTKGALPMILAGAVTFSVTNALLVHHTSKRLTEENALTISGKEKKAGVISQAEKKVKDQPQTTNVKDGKTKLSHNIAALQVAFKNRNKSDMDIKANKQNTKKLSKSTTTNLASTNETTAKTIRTTSAKATTTTTASTPTGTNPKSAATTIVATTIPATSAKAATTTSAPTPTETNTTSAPTPTGTNTTSATNRGQQVSLAAKEKASSPQKQKENNGKKM
jgi:hypothetical protein